MPADDRPGFPDRLNNSINYSGIFKARANFLGKFLV